FRHSTKQQSNPCVRGDDARVDARVFDNFKDRCAKLPVGEEPEKSFEVAAGVFQVSASSKIQAPIGEMARRSRKAKLQRAELDVARLMSQEDLVPGEVFLFRGKAIDLLRHLEDDRFALVGSNKQTGP